MTKKSARKKAGKKRSARPRRASSKFTVRQRRFIDEYAVDGNGAAAAIRAGYAANAAKQTASDLLTVPDVKAEIDRREKARSERVGFTADDALRCLIPLTEVNLQDFIVEDAHGNFRMAGLQDIKEMDRDTAAGLRELKETQKFDQFGNPIVEIDFKLHNPIPAITQAGKHKSVRAWTEQVEHTHSLRETMERIRGEGVR